MRIYGGWYKMKVKELINWLNGFKKEAEVFISSDEELNIIYSDVQVAYLENDKAIIMWGNSGSEVDEE